MPVDPDRLQAVISAELAQRRAEVVAIDGRLAPLADLLIGFVADGGKRLRPEFLFCGWAAAGDPGSPGFPGDPGIPSDPGFPSGPGGPGGPGDGPAGGSDGGAQERAAADAMYQVGASLELIQACALIHDDVIDRSDSRRGRPATHRAVTKIHAGDGLAGDAEHYGVSAAILLGDLALAWADDLFAAGAQAISRSRPGAVDRALPVWRAMRTEVLSGQLLDLQVTADVTTDPAIQAADAMRINRFKTAAYTVERPLHLGAALAGGSADAIAALRSFGTDVGIAFQLRDDLLGVFGDPAVTGKPAGDDLLEGKRTLLLATARAALSVDQRRDVSRDLPGDLPGDLAGDLAGDLLTELDAGIGAPGANVDRLAQIISDSGAPEVLERRVSELVASGLAALDARDRAGAAVVAAAAQGRLRTMATLATDRRF